MASGTNNNPPELGVNSSNSNNQSQTTDLGDEHEFKKRKRACKSKVWIDMIMIDNDIRAQCIHYKECYVIPDMGTTTTLARHLKNYNASANDAAMKILVAHYRRLGNLFCDAKFFDGKFLHVRCCAHILNLMMQDGLSVIKDIVSKVHASVSYINASDARLMVFSQVAQQLHLPDRKLILDCKTRWNSTYKMLSTAITFKEAFSMYEVREPLYKHCPSDDDWEKIESIYKTLEAFDACTNIVSGSDYPTSNLYFGEVQYIKQVLDRQFNDEHLRCKFTMLELYFKDLYDANEILNKNLELKKILREIHAENARLFRVRPTSSTSNSNSSSHGGETEQVGPSRWFSYYYSRLKQTDVFDLESSDLDVYLIEGIYLCKDNSAISFNILDWWKSHEIKFPILSKMAAHFLAIPITTVASEATLSASGRVIDTYRASLDPKIVQALICGGDWIRKLHGVKNKNKQQQSLVLSLSSLQVCASVCGNSHASGLQLLMVDMFSIL
ncbi:zinc finger BED domain-containing protein RICESLEEPER 2-like protein [Tanacetum coccineum]